MKISILGAGNVATQLALALKKAGHTIVQIFNRTDESGKELAHTVGATFTDDSTQLIQADIYLIAVKDDAIAQLANALQVEGKIVAHTSGSKSKDLLQVSSSNYGIFYPLQTMTKVSKVDFKNVPFLIEGSNEITTQTLEKLAQSISQNIHRVDEQQRQWVHVAAVFANNFTNHLFGISESLLLAQSLPFEILKPLLFSFIQNMELQSPRQLQTGPAARGDMQTIDNHLLLLANDERLKQIYEILTNSIIISVTQNHK